MSRGKEERKEGKGYSREGYGHASKCALGRLHDALRDEHQAIQYSAARYFVTHREARLRLACVCVYVCEYVFNTVTQKHQVFFPHILTFSFEFILEMFEARSIHCLISIDLMI